MTTRQLIREERVVDTYSVGVDEVQPTPATPGIHEGRSLCIVGRDISLHEVDTVANILVLRDELGAQVCVEVEDGNVPILFEERLDDG